MSGDGDCQLSLQGNDSYRNKSALITAASRIFYNKSFFSNDLICCNFKQRPQRSHSRFNSILRTSYASIHITTSESFHRVSVISVCFYVLILHGALRQCYVYTFAGMYALAGTPFLQTFVYPYVGSIFPD